MPSSPSQAIVWMPGGRRTGLEAGRSIQGRWSCPGKKMVEAGNREGVWRNPEHRHLRDRQRTSFLESRKRQQER